MNEAISKAVSELKDKPYHYVMSVISLGMVFFVLSKTMDIMPRLNTSINRLEGTIIRQGELINRLNESVRDNNCCQ